LNRTINQFQKNFAGVFNANYGISFWKARVGLYAILKSLGLNESDEVILPGYTCVMDVNPIKYVGAKPVYVDIEPDTFNMNVELLEEKITKKTKVIIAQHTYGYMCNIEKIIEIAERNNITVIEDCCLALGSKYKGKLAGTFGKVAYFSFQWNKPFTTGLGGMVITNDFELAEKIKNLCENELRKPSKKEVFMLAAQLAIYRMFIYPRTTAFAQSLFRWLTKKGIVVGSSSIYEFDPNMAKDFFKGMSTVQACSGAKQLKKLDNNIRHRIETTALYDKLLSEHGWSARNYNRDITEPIIVRYPVRITEKEKALKEAASAGVELGSWFECPLHPIETPLEKYDYQIGMCPEAEKASKEVVNLPLHLRVNEKTVRKTVEFITRFKQA